MYETDPLLRERQDKMSRVKNNIDLYLEKEKTQRVELRTKSKTIQDD